MNTYVTLHISFHFHNFRAVWASKLSWTNHNGIILKKNILEFKSKKIFTPNVKITWNFQKKYFYFNLHNIYQNSPPPCLRFTCSLRVDFRFVLKLQNVQLKGFSPVWIIIWRAISFLVFMILEQYGQRNSAGPIIIGSFCKKTYQNSKKLPEVIQ